MSVFLRFFSVLALLVLVAAPVGAAEVPEHYEQVYLTEPQALKVALPDAEQVLPRTATPSAEVRQRMERKLGRKLEEPAFTYYEGRTGGKPVGYAMILHEKGKYYPITFVVGFKPDGDVRDVAVMVYREKRGDAVRRRRFLNQFVGKTVDDPLMINRDLVHLTGATVSSWSIAAGVKKAAVILEELVKPGKTGS